MDYNIFKSPLRHFIKAKINGGAVLLFVAAAAMIIANTPLRESYDAFFAKEVILQFGDINLFHVHGGNMTFPDQRCADGYLLLLRRSGNQTGDPGR